MTKWIVCAAAVLLPVAGHAAAAADLKQNYQSIIDRNPFGLKPPPTPAPPPKPVVEKPKMDIFLTGITSIGYPRQPKRAYLKVVQQGQKEPERYAFQEDQMHDGIKVLSINPENSTVRISTPEGETLLSFKTHGVKPPAGAAGGMPGQPGAPGAPIPSPPSVPGQANVRVNAGAGYNPRNPAVRQVPPTRTVRTTRGAATAAGRYGSAPAVTTPGGSPPPMGSAPGQPDQQPEPIDPAMQYINLKLQEEISRQNNVPFPPVPPLN